MALISPKIFEVDSKFGIRSEAVAPGAGRIEGPSYSITIPGDVYWTGESWSRSVFKEFSNRESAQSHLTENMHRMISRAEKQFGAKSSDTQT